MEWLKTYSTLLMVIITLLYTIGSFLLWWETRKVSKLSLEESRITQRLIKGQLLSNAFDSYRELFKILLSHDDLIKLLDKNQDVSKFKKQTLTSLLINNASRMFYYNKMGVIDSEIWKSIVEDIKDLFRWDLVRKHWGDYKETSYKDFNEFVEHKIFKELKKEERQ